MSRAEYRNSFQNFFHIAFFADMGGKMALFAEVVGTVTGGVGVASCGGKQTVIQTILTVEGGQIVRN